MERQLTTRRLILREPRESDAPVVFERWAGCAPVLRYLDWRPHADVARTRALLAWDAARWIKRSAFTWMLLPRAPDGASSDGSSDGPIGQVQLVPQRLDGPAHHLRLGYVLAPAWRGAGRMTEAVAAVLDHALAQREVWRVDAVCDVDNPASARLLERVGMALEGRLAAHGLHPGAGPMPRDVWLYARVRRPSADVVDVPCAPRRPSAGQS